MTTDGMFKEVGLSAWASTAQEDVFAYIEAHITDAQKEQFRAEIRAVQMGAPIGQSSTDAEWVSRIMNVWEEFLRVLRAWQVSVVLHSDEEWMEEIRSGDGGDVYTEDAFSALGRSLRDDTTVG